MSSFVTLISHANSVFFCVLLLLIALCILHPVGIGGWVTAVSKKDRKNRSRKDENVKQEKNITSQNESVKPANPAARYTSKFVKSNKKVGSRCMKCNHICLISRANLKFRILID
jgi:hypothetical protein